MDGRDDLIGVLSVLYKWRKQIGLLLATVIVVVSVISWIFLYTYYKSSTIFYVNSTDIFKPEQMFGTSTKDMDYIGTSNDIDRILSIAESEPLKDFLIKKFDLYKHYDVDSTKMKAPYRVMEELDDRYKVKKTKLDAIELSVEDVDRKWAADIANAAREQIDLIAQQMIKQNQLNLLNTYTNGFAEKDKTLAQLGDSLRTLRQSTGVIDPEKQTEAMTTAAMNAENSFIRTQAKFNALKNNKSGVSRDSIAMTEATMRGFEEETKRNKEMMTKYNEGVNKVSLIKEMFERERDQKSKDMQRYIQLKTSYSAPISALNVIETAKIPVVKSRPNRMLLVLSSAMAALLFSVFGVLLFDRYKSVKWSEVMNDGKEVEDDNHRPYFGVKEKRKPENKL